MSGLQGSDQASIGVADLTASTTTNTTMGNGTNEFTLPTNDSYAVAATTTAAGYTMSTSTGCAGVLSTDMTCLVAFSLATSTGGSQSGLGITKTVDNSNPAVGDTIHYSVTLSALGPDTSTGVVATDLLPAGLTFVSATVTEGSYASSTGTWTIGDMPANISAVLVITATVNSGTAGQTITNTATATETSNNVNVSSSVSITVQSNGGGGAPLNASVTLTANPGTIPQGATSTLTWTSANATDCQASDGWTGAQTATGTDVVAPTSTMGYTITCASIDVGGAGASSSATVIVTAPNGGPSNYADIGITKTVDNANPSVGDTVNYTLTVSNLGPATSTDVVSDDAFPTGLDFVGASSSQGIYNLTTGVWTIGTVPANATATLTVAALVAPGTEGQTITNTATVSESSSLVDDNLANNSSSVSILVRSASSTPNADVAITKTVDNANPSVGDTVNYTLTVSDLGPATSTDVVASDTLPSGVTFVNATATVGSYASSTGTWTIGDLSASSSAVLTIAASVNSGTQGQTIMNTGTVAESTSTIDQNLANNSSSVSITVANPCTSNCGGGGGTVVPNAALSVVKTVDDPSPHEGDTIHYTITASATGPATSTGAFVTDTLPSGLIFVDATTSAGTYASSTGTWTIGDMPVNTTATLAIAATVNQGTAGQIITNTAVIAESSAVQNPSPNTSSSVSLTVQTPEGGTGTGGGGTIVEVGGGPVPTSTTETGSGTGSGAGEVLGASTSCGLYLDEYIHPIRQYLNDPTEVEKLQIFLNQNLSINLPISGNYDAQTIQAVDQFQVKYNGSVLAPWVPYGLPTQMTPTGYVYKTTQWWINSIVCASLDLPMPQLP